MDSNQSGNVLGFLVGIFWNRDQKRLRLAWRLAGFAVIYMLLLFVFGFLQVILISIMNPGISPEASFSPAGPEGFMLMGPLLMMVVTPLAMLLAALILDRRRYRDYGFGINVRWWLDLGFGLFLGAAIMLVIFLLEWGLGWIEVTPAWSAPEHARGFWGEFGVGILLFLAVGFYEEALSRGYLLRNIAEGLNAKWWRPEVAVLLATVITSALFGFAHASNPNATILSTVLISVAGIMLAAGYILTGELAIPIGIHITWNFFQGYVFGFPVSGMSSGSSVFIIRQGGPELWTGGRFGPEAGLLGLFAMLALTAAIWIYARRRGQQHIDIRLAEPTLRWKKGDLAAGGSGSVLQPRDESRISG